jgi:hypothetical protein
MTRDNVLYHLPIAVANAKHVGSFVRLADYTTMWNLPVMEISKHCGVFGN